MTGARRTAAVLAVLFGALPLGGCDDVRLGQPESLWAMWLVPALFAFYVYSFRRRRQLLRRFASVEMLARLARVSRPRQYFKAALVLLGLLTALLTLAELKYGFTWEEVKREGVDIALALDVSDSMLVRDAESGGGLSRLERAKREITDLLRLLEGDRIGLVAFAGTAFIECPLTLDYGAAEIFLDTIDTDLIPVKGTSLGEAIRTSLAAFEGASHPSRAIILMTDGEDHEGEALEAAQEAKLAGVRIFTIGIGRDEGAPIPAPGGGFRRDRRGEIVLSRLDETTLQKIALDTGGRYVRSVTGDVDLEQIYLQGIKATLEDQELGSRRRQRWEDRFQWVLAVALVALMLEPLISERGRRLASGAVAVALLLLPAPGAAQPPPEAESEAAPLPAPVVERFDDPYRAFAAGQYDQALQGFVGQRVEHPDEPAAHLNVGSAHYRMNNYEEAEKAFATAALSGRPELRQQALYNLGNCAFRQGRLEEAIEMYRAALELDPDDEDAKFNLEFVRDEIRRRHEEAQKRQQEQPSDPQQQQQDGQEQQQQDGQQGDQQQEQQEQRQGGEQPEPGGSPEGPDTDQDGLPDERERLGANPTDPENPDTDGDGLKDGEEDLNRSGSVDPGETDPNLADTDGDGIPDAEEAPGEGGASGGIDPELLEGLTPEEAERYLQALEEGRPNQQRGRGARTVRSRKDW